ncbi:GNAT family N-acetyltransferase [Salinicoccus sp. Marseille-QA3877]
MMDIKDKFFKDGKLVQIPRKEKMKLQLFDELIKDFDRNHIYKEKEVNGILKEIYPDYAILRRYLVDYQYLKREDDGSQYRVDTDVTLKYYDDSFYGNLEKYVLTEAHEYYSATPLDALKSCENIEGRNLVLIIQRRQVAGVFILQSGDIVQKYTTNPNALVMFNYSVDSTKQGHGVATASFRELDDFVNENYEGVDEVVLGVNVKNEVAQHVYKKGGFTDTGHSFIGPLGRQIIMSREIRA